MAIPHLRLYFYTTGMFVFCASVHGAQGRGRVWLVVLIMVHV